MSTRHTSVAGRGSRTMCALLLVAALGAATAGCTVGSPSGGPSTRSALPFGDESYAPVPDGAIRYDYPAAKADRTQNSGWLYLPAGREATASVPVVVLIHGGGWRSRASWRYMDDVADSLQEAGLAVWNIEYRRVGSGGGWPTTFTDVAAAVDEVPALARRHPQLDVSNVTFVGHSAGGQLAAWAASRRMLAQGAPGVHWPEGGAPAVVPRGVVSLAGVLDMRTSSRLNDHVRGVLGGMPDQAPDRYAVTNPVQIIDPRIPVVAIHGSRDQIVPVQESEQYVDAVHAAGGRAMFVRLDGAGHGTPVVTTSPWWPEIRDTIVRMSTRGFDDLEASPPTPPTRTSGSEHTLPAPR